MDVKLFKLVNGQEVIAEFEGETESNYMIINPVILAQQQDENGQVQLGFAPWIFGKEQQEKSSYPLNKATVATHVDPLDEIVSGYKQQFDPNAIIEPDNNIIT